MADKYIKKKSKVLKFLRHLIFLACATTLFFGAITGAWAYVRPANPTMDYVPQNIGIYDTYYENFHESDCRACHGASTEERHHVTYYALQGNCTFCHLDEVQPERDCKVCHIDGGPVGDLGSPHHRSDFAGVGKCNQCHTNVIEANSVDPPGFAPTSITPTPYSCENCHWPSGSVPHEAATHDGNTLEFLADWLNWTGYPVLTTWPDGLAHPQPIEANGPANSGILGRVPYSPADGTHHMIGGNASNRCYYCHASSPGTTPDWNPANPYLIRFCENCHDVYTLHSIQEHVTDNNIYRVGGTDNRLVTADMKCVACHSNYSILDPLPTAPSDTPAISHLEPNFGPPGIIVNILPASGICFKEDPVNGLCSFGQKMSGDRVMMGQKDFFGVWYWVNAPIYSWSEHQIQITVPDRTFDIGKTFVQVHKEQVGTSAFQVFVVLHNPVISLLSPSYSNWGQEVLVSGEGFSVKKESIYENGYGYSTYIELHSSDDRYRITRYNGQVSWDPNKILIELTDLLDINTGNPAFEQDLYPGCWNIKVITDYFRDNPVNGTPGKYNLDMGGFDPADQQLDRVISNPVCLTITKDPYINGVMPDKIPNGGYLEIDGVNFGSIQGQSYVLGGTDSALIEIVGDGKGNEDGVCEKAEYLENGCTLDPAKSKKIPVPVWTDSIIVCDLPTLSAGLPLRVHVQVVVEGTKKSNVKKIVIY
jgi:hypothetical protein